MARVRAPTNTLPIHERIVIFVHGILSNSRAFDKLLPNLVNLDPHHEMDFWVFDYDYRQTLAVSGEQLARAISERSFGRGRVDIVGHRMGGLVARMAVLRHQLPNVARIVTLATPNHGTISGAELNLLGQMTAFGFRQLHPIYARAPGIIDLTNVHVIMQNELTAMHACQPARLDGKSCVSIPAQYFHSKWQWGEPMPSIMMGGLTVFWKLVNFLARLRVDTGP
jgi:pimeloyl-ACP methyl ester carboxylesterase